MPDIVTAITAGTSVFGAMSASDAAEESSNAQQQTNGAQIAESRRQFDALQALLQPYVQAGTGSLGQTQNLLGLNGATAQQGAVSGFENSPYFQSIVKQSENAILQNASATGGLRGGNVQGALASTRPQLLQGLIDKQLANLSGITSMGANAAAGVGNAGLQTGAQINQALGAQGAAQAGGILGQASALSGGIGNIGGLLASRFPTGQSAPPVIDGGYSMGLGSAYGGLRAGL